MRDLREHQLAIVLAAGLTHRRREVHGAEEIESRRRLTAERQSARICGVDRDSRERAGRERELDVAVLAGAHDDNPRIAERLSRWIVSRPEPGASRRPRTAWNIPWRRDDDILAW